MLLFHFLMNKFQVDVKNITARSEEAPWSIELKMSNSLEFEETNPGITTDQFLIFLLKTHIPYIKWASCVCKYKILYIGPTQCHILETLFLNFQNCVQENFCESQLLYQHLGQFSNLLHCQYLILKFDIQTMQQEQILISLLKISQESVVLIKIMTL